MQLRSVFLSLSIVALGANASHAESIRSALAAAYNHNATLNAQRAATRAVDEGLAQAKSGYRPTITGDADYGFVGNNNSATGSSGNNPYGFGITISQPLFDGFRTVNRIAGAEAGILASREQLRRVEQVTLQSAARAYADVVRSRQLVRLRRQNIAFLREQVRSSNARLDVGEGTRTDVAQSDARLAGGRASLSAAQADLAAAEATYFQIIGRRPGKVSWPRGPSRLYPKSLNGALAMAANQHPAVKLTKYGVDVAAYSVKEGEGAFLPSVSLRGNAQRRFNSPGRDVDNSSISATVNVTVPIYQAGNASSVVRERKEVLAQRRIQVDEARDEVRAAAVTAWSLLSSARLNVQASRSQVRAAKLALSGVVEERNVGQRTQLEVLDAQSSVLTAEINLLESRKVQVDAGYALVAAVGRLNSRKLSLPVRHYSPKQHYKAVKDLWFGLRTPSGR